MTLLRLMLAQCPCRDGGGSGGGAGGTHPWLVLAIVAGVVWLIRRVWLARGKGRIQMSNVTKIVVVAVLALAVGGVIVLKNKGAQPPATQKEAKPPTATPANLPRLVDLGAGTCIPCKMMAPILEGLKTTYAGKLQVEFIDVRDNPAAAKSYGIKLIPTQVFFDGSGQERFRHEGFFSKDDILAKWKELGVDLTATPASQGDSAAVRPVAFSRMEPAKADDRTKDAVCYMCDGDINAKTRVTVQTDKGEVRLCGPHCYFIMYSCLTADKEGFEKKVRVTDWADGKAMPATDAVYLYGTEEKTGRPTVKAFVEKETAARDRQAAGGNVIGWAVLQEKELANRCGFCDRAVYPEDASAVKVDSISTWGCCSHCALGVAARTGKDIEVREKDRLTGEPIVVKTLNGSVASLEPKTSVAWFGMKKGADGKFASAGCFHQGFFVNEDNLKKWAEQHPTETGKQIPISQALADKMKLSAEQIKKACKIGECAPK